jgi:GxxExxY protein
MNEESISKVVVDKCFKIHRGLGPGLFESVYESVLCYELEKVGLVYERQVPVSVIWENQVLDNSFYADVIIENKLIVELKSIEKVSSVHQKQLLTYLRLSGIKLGLLINFGEELMKTGITRLINGKLE